jgi:hypothetical protein
LYNTLTKTKIKMSSIDYNELLMKPAVVGAAGGLMSLAIVGTDSRIFGMQGNLGLGVVMGVASLVSSSSNEFVYDKILGDQQSDLVYSIQAPVVTGLGAVVAGYGAFGSKMTLLAASQLFGLGVAAEMGGSYVSEAIAF